MTKAPVAELGMDMTATLAAFFTKDGSAMVGFNVKLKPNDRKGIFMSLDRLKALKAGLDENLALLEEHHQVGKNLVSNGCHISYGKVVIPSDNQKTSAPEQKPAEAPAAVVSEVTSPPDQSTEDSQVDSERVYSADQVANILQKLGL